MVGGSMQDVRLNTLFLGEFTKKLDLVNMPCYILTDVFNTLPHNLERFHIRNLDKFTLDEFRNA